MIFECSFHFEIISTEYKRGWKIYTPQKFPCTDFSSLYVWPPKKLTPKQVESWCIFYPQIGWLLHRLTPCFLAYVSPPPTSWPPCRMKSRLTPVISDAAEFPFCPPSSAWHKKTCKAMGLPFLQASRLLKRKHMTFTTVIPQRKQKPLRVMGHAFWGPVVHSQRQWGASPWVVCSHL